MQIPKLLVIPIVATLLVVMSGCEEDENKRLAEMAERNQDRQAEQSRQIINLQHEVAEGARRLVEADAQTREEMVTLQREMQSERLVIGQQRDALEDERRGFAASRRLDPIIATAIGNVGLLVACLAPLILGWYLLRSLVEPADDQAISELLLDDLVATKPILLSRVERNREEGESDTPRLPSNADPDSTST